MARKTAKGKKGWFTCGKCGDDFMHPRELEAHVKKEHKPRRRPAAKRRTSSPGRRGKKFEAVCEKCGRTEFKNKFSFAQHSKRFCKGTTVTVVPPIAAKNAFAGPSLMSQLLGKKDGMNGNMAERLKAEAAELRRKSDEILKYVDSFESGAQRFLSKQ